MGVLSAIRMIIYKSDLLNSASLLRIKGQPEHKTLLGGVISISLMIVLIAAFSNKILATLDKLIITASSSTSNADDPISFNITTLDNGPFMFGVEIWHHNLNEGSRYFDIVLTNTVYSYGEPQDSTIQYALEACTREHWNGYPQIQAKFDQLHINYWMCLPKNMSFEIKGKYSSVQSKTLDVSVNKCTNNSFNVRPCASQTEIDQMFASNGTLFFTLYFLNPLINPDSQSYLKYYLEDSNYIAFSQNGGEESRLFVEDYQISTDQSILPLSDYLVESGGIVTGSPLKSTYTQIVDTYAIFYFFKSPISISYERSFQKLDEVFSYIGGLFGIILIAFFLISSYNTYKFEVNLAGYLYRSEDGSQKLEKKYNFLHYIGQLIFTCLKMMNCEPKWEKLSFYYDTREEILKQLDILFLLKRINFLEQSLTFLFSNDQMKCLHLANHFTMSEAVRVRRGYRLKSRLKGEMEMLHKSYGDDLHFKRRDNVNESFGSQEQIFKSLAKLPDKIENEFKKSAKSEAVAHPFDSDRYSSDQSSEEEEVSVLDAIKNLQIEQNTNQTSKRILKNLDTCLQDIIQTTMPQEQLHKDPADFAESTLNHLENNEYPAKQLQIFIDPLQRNSIREQTNNEDNRVFMQGMFSRIKVMNSELSLNNARNDQ